MRIRDRIKSLRRVTAKDLRPNPRNWRTHPEAQQNALRGVLAQVGIADALLARELPDKSLMLIDGHLRADVDPETKWPVLVLDVTEEEADLLLATVDPLADMAEADGDILADLLENVEAESEAVQAMLDGLAEEHGIEQGNDEDIPEAPEPQIDRAAELQKEWKTKTGQLWLIEGKAGVHRVLCGDSTKVEDAERLASSQARALVSDPPYGIGYEYASHDDTSNAENLRIVKAAFEHAPTARIWSCGKANLGRDLAWNVSAKVLCWHKAFAQARNGLGGASTWEPILVVGATATNLPNDYLHFGTDREPGLREKHPCPKPVALFAHLIAHLTTGAVYDPFLGSGTTLVACEQLSRIGVGIEIEPKYVAVTLQRLADMGLAPKLEG